MFKVNSKGSSNSDKLNYEFSILTYSELFINFSSEINVQITEYKIQNNL